jgi:hypothetical protein
MDRRCQPLYAFLHSDHHSRALSGPAPIFTIVMNSWLADRMDDGLCSSRSSFSVFRTEILPDSECDK